jgi:NAD(P)-dependent dehydrogenase (short-subunit alcohol dehydrogenase family)
VIGATGTIGKAVVDSFEKRGHEVICASRASTVAVDIGEIASLFALFDRTKDVDAVVCCAGGIAWGPLASLTDKDFAFSLSNKLMGQVNVIRVAKDKVKDGGSITVTSGTAATKPQPGGAAASLVNAGLEGFVRAAALEMERGVRVNAVSPPWVKETLRAMKMDESPGLASVDVAKAYVVAVEGKENGMVFEATRFV